MSISIFITNPFNQIIKFSKIFTESQNYLFEFCSKVFEYFSKNANNSNLYIEDFLIFIEKNLDLFYGDKNLNDIENQKENFLKNIINFFSVEENENISNEKVLEFIRNLIIITPYVKEMFIYNLLQIKSDLIINLNLIFNSKKEINLFKFLFDSLNLKELFINIENKNIGKI